MTEPISRSGALFELFDRAELDPEADEILAVALLSEEMPNFVPVDEDAREVFEAAKRAGPPPQDAEGGDADAAASLWITISKIVPGFKPTLIPSAANLTPRTRCVGRRFRTDESLEPQEVNQTLATMLADLLDDEELEGCSAISLGGESPELGATRFALVARSSGRAG